MNTQRTPDRLQNARTEALAYFRRNKRKIGAVAAVGVGASLLAAGIAIGRMGQDSGEDEAAPAKPNKQNEQLVGTNEATSEPTETQLTEETSPLPDSTQEVKPTNTSNPSESSSEADTSTASPSETVSEPDTAESIAPSLLAAEFAEFVDPTVSTDYETYFPEVGAEDLRIMEVVGQYVTDESIDDYTEKLLAAIDANPTLAATYGYYEMETGPTSNLELAHTIENPPRFVMDSVVESQVNDIATASVTAEDLERAEIVADAIAIDIDLPEGMAANGQGVQLERQTVLDNYGALDDLSVQNNGFERITYDVVSVSELPKVTRPDTFQITYAAHTTAGNTELRSAIVTSVTEAEGFPANGLIAAQAAVIEREGTPLLDNYSAK